MRHTAQGAQPHPQLWHPLSPPAQPATHSVPGDVKARGGRGCGGRSLDLNWPVLRVVQSGCRWLEGRNWRGKSGHCLPPLPSPLVGLQFPQRTWGPGHCYHSSGQRPGTFKLLLEHCGRVLQADVRAVEGRPRPFFLRPRPFQEHGICPPRDFTLGPARLSAPWPVCNELPGAAAFPGPAAWNSAPGGRQGQRISPTSKPAAPSKKLLLSKSPPSKGQADS